VLTDPSELGGGLRPVLDMRVADEPHHFRVRIHRGERVEILIPPAPKDEPFGLEPTFG
jgi:hypothetical protein